MRTISPIFVMSVRYRSFLITPDGLQFIRKKALSITAVLPTLQSGSDTGDNLEPDAVAPIMNKEDIMSWP
ncbi:hypothetical protein, partial [Cedecea sp.]|uniref:hypothetical protein n=1 Tax=Cedecea sp. TaxID=1970739 RepID=UPI002F41CB1D